jgi:ABC-type transporter Mla MlaB component
LRITIDEGPATLVLKLEGRVIGPWACALRESWNSLDRSGTKDLVIDLCGVTHVDTAGRQVLADIYTQSGARFRANTPMTQYFAEEAVRQGATKQSNELKGKQGG